MLLESIQNIEKDALNPFVQQIRETDKKAPKIERDLLKVDWSNSAVEIHNLIRGLSPILKDDSLLKDVAICPSAWFYLLVENGKQIRVKLLLSDFETISHSLENNSILTDNKSHLKIAVKDGFVNILKLQMEGKKSYGY